MREPLFGPLLHRVLGHQQFESTVRCVKAGFVGQEWRRICSCGRVWRM